MHFFTNFSLLNASTFYGILLWLNHKIKFTVVSLYCIYGQFPCLALYIRGAFLIRCLNFAFSALKLSRNASYIKICALKMYSKYFLCLAFNEFSLESSHFWHFTAEPSTHHGAKRIVLLQKICGREPNLMARLDNGMNVCVKYRPTQVRIYAEILVHYLAHILQLSSNTPSVVLSRVRLE